MNETIEQRQARRRFMVRAGLRTYLDGMAIGIVAAPFIAGFFFIFVGWTMVYGDGQPPLWFVIVTILVGVCVAFVAPLFPAHAKAKRAYDKYLESQAANSGHISEVLR